MSEQNGIGRSATVDVVNGAGTADSPTRYYPLVKIKDTLSVGAGEDIANNVVKVEQRFSFLNITTATTTVVKTGPGFLHSIVVGTTAAGTITVFDNTAASGTRLIGLVASITPGTYTFDCAVAIGLTVVTAAASDIAIIYR